MDRLQRRTIHRHFFWLNILVVVPVVVLVAVIGNIVFRYMLTAKARDAQIREVSLICNSLDVIVENINEYLLTLSVDPSLQDLLAGNPAVPEDYPDVYDLQRAFSRVVYNKTGLNSYIDSVGLVARDGAFFPFGEYRTEDLEALVADGRVPLNEAPNQPVWYGPFPVHHRVQGEQMVFIVAKPVVDLYSPNTLGAILLVVQEAHLSEFYRGAFRDQSTFFVVNRDDTVITAQDPALLLSNVREMESTGGRVPDVAANGYTVQSANGEDLLVTTRLLNRNQWLGVSTIRMADLTRDLWVINLAMLGLGLAAVGIAVALAAVLARSVSRPIVALAGVMTTIDDSTLDVRIPPVASPVEIRQLEQGFNSLMDRVNGLMEQNSKQQQQLRRDEFRLLQSQIKPHFLYNSLEAIQSLVGLGMNPEANEYLKHLAGFYRGSLSSGRELITLRQEMELTRNYLYSQHVRYIEVFDFTISEDHALDLCRIPKLTLQPLVENAIYHGARAMRRKCHIDVRSFCSGGAVCITVRDDGAGMPPGVAEKVLQSPEGEGESFGLRATHERLQIIYGPEWGLSVDSEAGVFTCVTVRLPINGEEAPDAAHPDCG